MNTADAGNPHKRGRIIAPATMTAKTSKDAAYLRDGHLFHFLRAQSEWRHRPAIDLSNKLPDETKLPGCPATGG